MTDSSIFDDMDKPKKYCSCHKKKKKEKQTILWTVYHTILAVELGMIVIIETIELLGGL
jgi:hypothetical protein